MEVEGEPSISILNNVFFYLSLYFTDATKLTFYIKVDTFPLSHNAVYFPLHNDIEIGEKLFLCNL